MIEVEGFKEVKRECRDFAVPTMNARSRRWHAGEA